MNRRSACALGVIALGYASLILAEAASALGRSMVTLPIGCVAFLASYFCFVICVGLGLGLWLPDISLKALQTRVKGRLWMEPFVEAVDVGRLCRSNARRRSVRRVKRSTVEPQEDVAA